mmetsp:Transcript_25561/g.50339  ORF Transcript_25561/g.50339 Transcript_25561/m.50339 type:complete len:204 (+) Transcript_25561:1963-2574(+)
MRAAGVKFLGSLTTSFQIKVKGMSFKSVFSETEVTLTSGPKLSKANATEADSQGLPATSTTPPKGRATVKSTSALSGMIETVTKNSIGPPAISETLYREAGSGTSVGLPPGSLARLRDWVVKTSFEGSNVTTGFEKVKVNEKDLCLCGVSGAVADLIVTSTLERSMNLENSLEAADGLLALSVAAPGSTLTSTVSLWSLLTRS